MNRKLRPLKINWWRLIRNIGKIRQLIEDIRRLYIKVGEMSDDPILKNRIKAIEEAVDNLF